MGFTVNFSDVQNFEALPAGIYSVAIVDMEEVNSSPSGFPYFKVTMEILDGEFANRRLWSNLSLSPKAAWKLQEALLAFGESSDDLVAEFEFDPEKYLGVECKVSVSQTNYEGRLGNAVDNFLPNDEDRPVVAASRPKLGKPAASTARKPTIR